jgi:hypothetical protein
MDVAGVGTSVGLVIPSFVLAAVLAAVLTAVLKGGFTALVSTLIQFGGIIPFQ